MRVRYEGGILVQEALKEVILDPARKTPGSIVSHGHMDHLTSGGIMTPQTVAVLKVRRGGTGQPLPYGKEIELNGFRVVLRTPATCSAPRWSASTISCTRATSIRKAGPPA